MTVGHFLGSVNKSEAFHLVEGGGEDCFGGAVLRIEGAESVVLLGLGEGAEDVEDCAMEPHTKVS